MYDMRCHAVAACCVWYRIMWSLRDPRSSQWGNCAHVSDRYPQFCIWSHVILRPLSILRSLWRAKLLLVFIKLRRQLPGSCKKKISQYTMQTISTSIGREVRWEGPTSDFALRSSIQRHSPAHSVVLVEKGSFNRQSTGHAPVV